MHLDPDAVASARLMTFDTLGSTSAEALSRARAGEQGPLWIVAERQTAGRGRRGNAWTSEPGNLFASLLLTEGLPAAHLPELCFVVALAVRDAIGEAAPHLGPRLKL
jgi:BirA family biotin operon repressor/biotin-[acetyl-CoA-carboxylase] ligase